MRNEIMQVVNSGGDKHLVIADGWKDEISYGTLTKTCVSWLLRGKGDTRRLAFICSVASRQKKDFDLEKRCRAREFPVWSWTLQEYLEAVKNEDVFASVSAYLDAPGDANASREAMVEAKYYYAGGSCRFMFFYNTREVITELRHAVESAVTAESATEAGPRSTGSVNRLRATFRKGSNKVWPVISRFAAEVISIESGPDTIKKFMALREKDSNPSLNGWMLEMVFFAHLRKGGLDILDKSGNKTGEWVESDVDIEDGVPETIPEDETIWIKPLNWKQGGYDAIMVSRAEGLVRFVQVTRAKKHSLRLDFMYAWIKALGDSTQSFTVETVEVVVLVERTKLTTFKISPSSVVGQGLFSPFKWPKGKELEHVRKVGMKPLLEL